MVVYNKKQPNDNNKQILPIAMKREIYMRDFPVFTTKHGVASLIFSEVPYKGIAYIRIQDTLEPQALLRECVDFCKTVGAQKIYATGHAILEAYPFHTAIWQMRRMRDGLPETDAALFPVTEKTIEEFRSLYNERMANVSHAATMTRGEGEKLLLRGAGYFVHRGETLLGIGIAAGDAVEAVIAARPGMGTDVMLALCSALFSENVMLEVASDNLRARKLYDKLGFIKTAELSRWYDVSKILQW